MRRMVVAAMLAWATVAAGQMPSTAPSQPVQTQPTQADLLASESLRRSAMSMVHARWGIRGRAARLMALASYARQLAPGDVRTAAILSSIYQSRYEHDAAGRITAITPWSWVATAMTGVPSPNRSATSASRMRLNLPPKSLVQRVSPRRAPPSARQSFTEAAVPPRVRMPSLTVRVTRSGSGPPVLASTSPTVMAFEFAALNSSTPSSSTCSVRASATAVKLWPVFAAPNVAAAAGDQVCQVANYNAPAQIVIAGHRAAVDRAVEAAREALADQRTGDLLARIYPQDKTKNAHGYRRALEPQPQPIAPATDSEPIPPLLRKLISDYAATGLPPAYIPKDEIDKEDQNE